MAGDGVRDDRELCRLTEMEAHESECSTDVGCEDGLLDDESFTSEHVAEDSLPFSSQGCLLLFDWDDSIMPTSWAEKNGLMREGAAATSHQWSQLQVLAGRVAETLAAATQLGSVVIVTNAAEGWVQQSCLRFLPSIAPVLERLRIVSARSAFEPLGVRSATEWKVRAFEREVGRAFSGELAQGVFPNVVSVGDSQHEHRALLRSTQVLPNCCAKSLKLVERPTIEQLIEEHELIAGSLEEVVQYEEDLDVDVGDSV